MELDDKFIAAVDVIKNLPSYGPFEVSNEMKLQFYAYYKQATVGPCHNSRPGFWDVVNRAKHDAWAGLGSMTRDAAMSKYVDNLKSIVETMNFSPDVENFMEALGPFYEEVEEDEEINRDEYSDKTSPVVANINPIAEEDPPIKDMLGRYDISETSLTDETSDSDFQNENAGSLRETYSGSRRGLSVSQLTDFKDNQNCPSQLYEELQKTRQSLKEAKTLMNNNNEAEESLSYKGNTVPGLPGVSGRLSQREIDRMLGNIDGFIPRIVEEHDSDLILKTDGHETEEELFEDSLDTITPEDCNRSGGHFNVEAKVITSSDSDSSPPAAPVHIPRTQSGTFTRRQGDLEDEDEILVVTAEHEEDGVTAVTSCHSCHEEDGVTVRESVGSPEHDEDLSHDISLQLALAVDRLNSDVEHLQARIKSVETIVVLQEDRRTRSPGWLCPELEPGTVLFMLAWPLVSHALIHLASAAFRKSRH